LVFTGDEFSDGGDFISKTLAAQKVKANFFLTGRFYDNPKFKGLIKQLGKDGHYLGPHSYGHLLYCDWTKRDSLLVSRQEFTDDLSKNLSAIGKYGQPFVKPRYFMPPYEWYNESICKWSSDMGIQIINFTPGTLSNGDYTTPDMKNYRSSEVIWNSIIEKESKSPSGLNGYILLVHIGTDPKRIDKFYKTLPELLKLLTSKGYQFLKIDQLLN
jgi:peptidoglycan/xylan/chitin deacetylase (PgdA/CDA1 family)